MRELSGRTALITGASGGLGRHLARALAAEGMSLVLAARTTEALEPAAEELRARGTRVELKTADLTRREDAARLVADAEAALAPIDVLVNNAGIEITSRYVDVTDDEIDALVAVNLTAPMRLIRAALPGMLARGRGHVVNIASLSGKVGVSCNVHYGATKAGVIALTRSLRAEFRDAPVGFSVVSPGFIADDGMYARMEREHGVRPTLLTRPSRPEKVAAKAVKAIRDDLPDVTVNGAPVAPGLVVAAASPKLGERIAATSGVDAVFETVASRRAAP